MKILAIETSCDDTAVAIVENGRQVLSSVIDSQTELHAGFGGVVPEAAARDHIHRISPVLEEALAQANLPLTAIDCFAATLGPGLVGSLLVGANTAKTLSLITGKPFRGVHHLQAHVASNYLGSDLAPPFLCLLVSGGHTQLMLVERYDCMRLIGETLDDAVGEAYDKVARLMGLPYPGGPHLDKLAQGGNPDAFSLPIAKTQGAYDFSFSGLKTAMMRLVEQVEPVKTEANASASAQAVSVQADLAASFQQTVVRTLSEKTMRCLNQESQGEIPVLAVAGGVSANQGLRTHLAQLCAARQPEVRLYLPQLRFCTDNAAMVAAAAFYNPLTEDVAMEVFSRTPVTP